MKADFLKTCHLVWSYTKIVWCCENLLGVAHPYCVCTQLQSIHDKDFKTDNRESGNYMYLAVLASLSKQSHNHHDDDHAYANPVRAALIW